MRRLLIMGTFTIAALTFAAGNANAAHSNGVRPGKGFVSGTGKVSFLGLELSETEIHLNADSKPSPDGSFGHFFADVTGLGFGARFSGRIVCLDVAGNEARVGGVVTRSDSPLVPPGTNTIGRVVDNGESSRNDPPDLFVGEVGVPAALCPVFTQPAEEVREGNFVVHAAP